MSSRQELIQWVNDLLLLSYTKVEQLGTGAWRRADGGAEADATVV